MLLHRQLPLSVIKFLVACVLLLAGCQKEKAIEGMLQIDAEVLKSNSKAVVDGLNSSWQAGDEIRFGNGLTKTVVVDGDRFYVDSEGITSGLAAVCPASAVKEGVVTLPATYQYRTDASGHQVVDMPMAAYYDGESSLFFKHLTGGLFFNVSNNTGATVMLDRITVENAVYYMNGATLPLSSINAAFLDGDRCFTTSGDDAERKRVSLLFNDGLELASGASRQLLVPVPAFATDAAFTVTVYAHNGDVSCFHFNQTQGDGHIGHIAASQAGFANIALGSAASQPFEGLGTEVSPYQIYTKEDYKRMVNCINGATASYRSSHYDIAADIDMCGETVNGMRQFNGVLDGKGHTISNICFTNNDIRYLGLVSLATSSCNVTIRNLTLSGVSFVDGGWDIGAFIGYSHNSRFTLQNCHLRSVSFPGTFYTSSAPSIGGLVGLASQSNDTIKISNCSVEGGISFTVTTGLNFGGIIGYINGKDANRKPVKINNCTVGGPINVTAGNNSLRFGGIIGSANYYTVLSLDNVSIAAGSSMTTSVNSTLNVGGLIGYLSGGQAGFVGCSYSSILLNAISLRGGTSTNFNSCGGVIGNTANVGCAFEQCVFSGTVSLTKALSNDLCQMGKVIGTKGGGTLTFPTEGTDANDISGLVVRTTNENSARDDIGNLYSGDGE